MRRLVSICCIIIFGFACLMSCSSREKGKENTIQVFSASSMTNVMTEIADSFREETKLYVQFNFASSGTLARQISQGADADLYISANSKWVEYLVNLGEVESVIPNIVSNRLVLIAPKEIKDFDRFDLETMNKLIGSERLVISDPLHVPAGIYSMQALNRIGFNDTEKLLKTKDVRSSLRLIELGEFPLGIVYETDALESKKVKIIHRIDQDYHSDILYNIAASNDRKSVITFLDFMKSSKVKAIFKSYGFKI